LAYDPSSGLVRSLDTTDVVDRVRSKLVEVLAAVRSRYPEAVNDFFVRHEVSGSLQERIRARRTEERIAADLLKGGLGPWGQFEVLEGFSRDGLSLMRGVFETATNSQSFQEFIFRLAQQAVNKACGTTIFVIPESSSKPMSGNTSEQKDERHG